MQTLELTVKGTKSKTTVLFFVSEISRIGGNEKGCVVITKDGKAFEVFESISKVKEMVSDYLPKPKSLSIG